MSSTSITADEVRSSIIRAVGASRDADPPVELPRGFRQEMGVISLRLFDKPWTLPSGATMSGFLKFRACGPESDMDRYVENAIRETSGTTQKLDFLFCPAGKYIPITNDEKFISNLRSVAAEDTDSTYRTVAKETFQREQKAAKDVHDRLEKARSGPAPHDDPTTLEFEVYKRVTFQRLTESIIAAERKVEELKQKRVAVHRLLKQFDKAYPERADARPGRSDGSATTMSTGAWLDLYNEGRAKSGYKAFIPGRAIDAAYASWKGDCGTLNVEALRKAPMLAAEIAETAVRAPVTGEIEGTADSERPEVEPGSMYAIHAPVRDVNVDPETVRHLYPEGTTDDEIRADIARNKNVATEHEELHPASAAAGNRK